MLTEMEMAVRLTIMGVN